jgi:anti-sigma regulatory factor (Ser/Thr protein kinase)
MARAMPVPSETPPLQSSQAASDKSGDTVLDREFGATSLSGLRGAVQECASAVGLTSERAIGVVLALHELAANVIRHGAGRGRLLMEVTPSGLLCEISDAGIEEHVSELADAVEVAEDAARAAAWPVEHGHGLWLVRRTADQVQVISGQAGSVVRVVFTLPA